ncbi:hypothetical protein GCM10025789_30440 [Tessaracoccus lubricantis]|uniref:PEP-CTERM protein-sorting domain-containing protein n=1 Tax=Tessaracoccus lubricantis TaxID=545543 RepID=A0ABP9FN84_9ACTN
MKVLSPVGRFGVDVKGVRLREGRPVFDVSMGAWSSEVTLEPTDMKYVILAGVMLGGAFALGRMTSRARNRR